MEVAIRTQTAFRLKNSLLERLKWNAKKAGKSLNSYVEEELEKTVGKEMEFPKLPASFFEQANDLEQYAIQGCKLPGSYTDKELLTEALLEKYGEGFY